MVVVKAYENTDTLTGMNVHRFDPDRDAYVLLCTVVLGERDTNTLSLALSLIASGERRWK